MTDGPERSDDTDILTHADEAERRNLSDLRAQEADGFRLRAASRATRFTAPPQFPGPAEIRFPPAGGTVKEPPTAIRFMIPV